MALWKVPVHGQSTLSLCWEACARMMWHWRFGYLNGYTAKAGAFLDRNTGLTQPEMDTFYTQLGMRSLKGPKGPNLRHALSWTPVIFTDINEASGHAMVLAGFDGAKYTVVNPCATESVDFGTDIGTCAAGTIVRTQAQVERPLGTFMWYW